MSAIFTADIHLNDKPADSHRWGLFSWLAEQKADELIIGGDLTDMKDRHGARLVNRLYREIMALEPKFKIIINRGNHDYYDVDHPFFEFLGDSSDIVFVTKPTKIALSIGSALFVPAGAGWDFDIPDVDYLFAHATFSGAKAENGRTLTGVDPRVVVADFDGKVWSGDIHTPQTLAGGKIEYVGAPYHTRFGDDFDPRVVLIENSGRTKDLHFPAPRKRVLEITEPGQLLDEDADPGDHVKVRCLLRRTEYDKWKDYCRRIREIARSQKWLLFGAEPVALSAAPSGRRDEPSPTDGRADPGQLVADYAKKHKATKAFADAGMSLLRDAQ